MEGIWFHALFSVTLTLIWQFAIIYVDAPVANVTCVSLQDLLRSIPTFQGGFQDITLDHKALILINGNSLDLSQINLEVHGYKSDKDFTLPPHDKTAGSSPPGTPLPGARVYEVFVDVATRNKVIYKQAAREKEANIENN